MEKIKILVAEDEEILQMIYERELTDAVFDVRIVGDGQTAMDVYLDWNPDIIILDFRMPRMTGYTVLKNIREEHNDNDTLVIIATGVSDKDDVMACINLGIQGYVVKPIKLGKFAQKILGYYERQHPAAAAAALKTLLAAQNKRNQAEKKAAAKATVAQPKAKAATPPKSKKDSEKS